jgi:hypothetical protein
MIGEDRSKPRSAIQRKHVNDASLINANVVAGQLLINSAIIAQFIRIAFFRKFFRN